MQRKMIYWKLRDRELQLGERTLVMGVLNITPDSFSDGGRYSDPEKAYARALELEEQGADVIDIGAESTRPGAEPVSADEEWRRLVPVLKKLRGALTVPVSLDTYKSETAERALQYDVHILNDPSGLTFDPSLAKVAASGNMGLILNHMRGRPEQWAKMGPLSDAIGTVVRELDATQSRARHAGVDRQRIMLDPGIGFGKRKEQNSELLAHLGQLAKLDLPILVGPSRKSFLAQGSELETSYATAAAVTAAVLNGAHMVRVHDVAEMLLVIRVADEILKAGAPPPEQHSERAVPKARFNAPGRVTSGDEKPRPTRPPMRRPEPVAGEITAEAGAPSEPIKNDEAPAEVKSEAPPAQKFPPPARWERRDNDRRDNRNGDRPPQFGGDRRDAPPFRREDRPAAASGDRPPFRKPGGDRPFQKSFGKPFGKPGDRPFARSGDRPFAKPGDRPFRKPGDRPFSGPGDRPFSKPAGRPNDRPFSKPGERPSGDRPFGKPNDRPFSRPGDRPFSKPGDRPFRKPGDRPFSKPGDRPFSKPGDRPFSRPGDRPFRKPGDRPAGRSDGPQSGDRPGGGRPPFNKFGPPRGDGPRGGRPSGPRKPFRKN